MEKILALFMAELIFLHMKIFCKAIKECKPPNGNMGQEHKPENKK